MAGTTVELQAWPPRKPTALLVSPLTEDHTRLEDLFREQNWRLESALTVRLAILLLPAGRAPVVIVAEDLWMGNWKDFVTAANSLPNPPFIIVASEHPNEKLKLEVLNAGGHNLISKPFDRTELCPVLQDAWRGQQNGKLSSIAGEAGA